MENKKQAGVPTTQKQQPLAKMVNRNDIAKNTLDRIAELQNSGFTMPVGYNPTNAIKSSMMIISELEDRNGVPALQCCTPQSVGRALFEMVIEGLDASRKQCYFIIRGNKLTMMPSYFGTVTQAKRVSKNYSPIVQYVHEGDKFEIGIDVKTGLKFIKKHETSPENLDKEIIYAYTYITDENNVTDVLIMTKKQWMASWAKSSMKNNSIHNEFSEDMIKRTIIKKGCKVIINSDGNYDYAKETIDKNEADNTEDYQDFDEAEEISAPSVKEEKSTSNTKSKKNDVNDVIDEF